MSAQVHPQLERLLEEADASSADSDTCVEAVVTLLPSDVEQVVDSPEATIQKGQELVARVKRLTAEDADAVTIFEHMQSMAVRARPRFLRALLEQPEIESALPNQPQDL